jgi:hypothetical protein
MSPNERVRVLEEAPRDGWIAFSKDEERLVAYGMSYTEVVSKANVAGEQEPVIVKVPADWKSMVL